MMVVMIIVVSVNEAWLAHNMVETTAFCNNDHTGATGGYVIY